MTPKMKPQWARKCTSKYVVSVMVANYKMLELAVDLIDYWREDRTKSVNQEATLVPLDNSWLRSFRKPRSSPPKTESFSPEMHLKIQLSSRGLKLSNSKPGCRVSSFHFFVIQILPTAFGHQAHSDKCFSQLHNPRLTTVSLVESELGFEIVTQLADTGKRPSSHL